MKRVVARFRDVVRFLGGSAAVYAIIVACSSGGRAPSGDRAAAGSGPVVVPGYPVPDASAAPTTGSGNRLKSRFIVADDGTKQLLPGWYDAERKEECSFQRSPDGTWHCLPSVTALMFFGDAECTVQPLTQTLKTPQPAGCPWPTATVVYVAEPCGGLQRFEISKTLLDVNAPIYTKSGETCTAVSEDLVRAYRDVADFYPLVLTGTSPMTAFVAATERIE